MLQENNYELNIGNHREFTNLLCSSFTRIGAAILTYPDPADNSLTITLILVIFDGDDTSNYPNCVNPKEGSAGQGKFTFFINNFFLIYHYNWFVYFIYYIFKQTFAILYLLNNLKIHVDNSNSQATVSLY